MTKDGLDIELSIYKKLKNGNTLTDAIDEIKKECGIHYVNTHDVYYKDLPSNGDEFYYYLFKLHNFEILETVGDYCIYKNLYHTEAIVFGRDMKKMPMTLDYFEYDLYSLKDGTIEMIRYMIDIHGSRIPFHYKGELIISEEMKHVLLKAGMVKKELEQFDFFEI